MNVPKVLYKQIKAYEAHGFHLEHLENRAGSHWFVRFKEFPQAQIITANAKDPRALKNNIARYRRLAKDTT